MNSEKFRKIFKHTLHKSDLIMIQILIINNLNFLYSDT